MRDSKFKWLVSTTSIISRNNVKYMEEVLLCPNTHNQQWWHFCECVCSYKHIHLYVCMYVHNGMNGEKGKLLIVWYTLRFHILTFFLSQGKFWVTFQKLRNWCIKSKKNWRGGLCFVLLFFDPNMDIIFQEESA